MPDYLTLHQLRAGYDRNEILHGVSLFVAKGEAVGLFGPNGHGKTTLLRSISGLVRVRGGDILFEGQSLKNLSPRAIVDKGIIHVPQGNTLFPEMTVFENLSLGAYSPRAWEGKRERLEQIYHLFPRLAERRTQRCKTLSGGERQMVSVSMGLMCNPELLLLDEPTLGLSPKLKEELRQAIANIVQKNISLLLVEQDIAFLQSLTQRMYFMNHGEITQEFASHATLDREQIMELYFKEGHGA